MQVRFRPMDTWPRANTTNRRGRNTFSATWSATLGLLERELGHLGARDVVIQTGLREQDIRVDGWPKENAQAPWHPGVIVAFDSRHGALQYMTDTCVFWQHNVRSIALGLEALRAVDRYGVSAKGEQYTGWKALPPGTTALGAAMTVEQAACFIAESTGEPGRVDDVKADPYFALALYKDAAKRLHPDVGGDPDEFRRLQEARDLLTKVGGPA